MASRLLTSRLRSSLSSLLLRSSLNPLSVPSPPLLPNPLCHPLPLIPFSLPFSTSSRRLPSSRPRHVDIGARARQLQNRRLWTYALTFGCVAGFIVIVLSTFQDQLVFYITPTDALSKFTSDPKKSRFRLGGLVLEGSVVHPSPNSPEMEFVVTDLITDILVRYEGSLPDLFREGHSVVVEGFLKPFPEEIKSQKSKASEKARSSECFFMATEVLAKHDEKYMPKEVAEALERNKKTLEAEQSTATSDN
ncbi:Cytochrome c-type biogenesis protein CcmE [Carex littledalei]|uniref:Cytochrome c-type biogenesis protein CcmE n=1 Tax=Carex littledalei TaxID=544730 RepID=A0A833VDE7_9POAL|nr:Cytochrome c-type biogenesis protein CcmE [Carex littledalei]